MSADGIAVVLLGPLDDPEALHPNLTRFGDGAYRLSTFLPYAKLQSNPPKVMEWLQHQLGSVLNLHTDPRGVFVYAEQAHEADEYEDLLTELGEGGFWAVAAEPEVDDELPRALKEMAASAMAAITGAASPLGQPPAEAEPEAPAASGGTPNAEKSAVGDRYDGVAQQLEQAAMHLRRTAEHFRKGDVPRASAHRVAAEGYLVGVRLEMDGLAVLHAQKSS